MKRFKSFLYALINPQCSRGFGVYFGSSVECRWHRYLAFNLHRKVPRLQWYLVLSITTILWYFCIFWFQLLLSSCWAFKQNQLNHKTIGKLLYLGLWIGVSPYNYFALDLLNVEKRDWLTYIFVEEQLSWYTLFNQNDTKSLQQQQNHQNDVAILHDKQAFSEHLLNNNLPAIQSLDVFTSALMKQPHIIENRLDKLITGNIDFFIKPQSCNAMRGCLWGTIQQQSQECTAFGFDLARQYIQLRSKQDVLEFILTTLHQLDELEQCLLVQERYKSMASIENILDTHRPISLRLITFRQIQNPEKIHIHYAFIEESKPVKNGKMHWLTHDIDIATGEFKNYQIEEWPTIVEYITKAHSLFPTINSIAWDTILTEKGLKIIEGNYGWDIIQPQRLSKKPAIQHLLYFIN